MTHSETPEQIIAETLGLIPSDQRRKWALAFHASATLGLDAEDVTRRLVDAPLAESTIAAKTRRDTLAAMEDAGWTPPSAGVRDHIAAWAANQTRILKRVAR